MLLFFCGVNDSFEATSPTRCLVSFARGRAKQEGASGRNGSKKHTREKRGGESCKDPAVPTPSCVAPISYRQSVLFLTKILTAYIDVD